MSPAHYSRISADSEDESGSVSVRFSNSPQHRRKPPSASIRPPSPPSPWTCECISRLFAIFVLWLVAMGFAIYHFPAHKFHSHGGAMHGHSDEHHHKVYTKAAVAAGQQECSTIGVDILKKGGNAVDAAIATLLCEGVIEPQYSGIGGGFFMTIFNKTHNNFTVIDAREVAPHLSNKTMYKNLKTIKGPLAVAVPGALKGMSMAYDKYGGGVSWKELFLPSIEKAKEFKVNGELANRLSRLKKEIVGSKELCDVYCDASKHDIKKTGDKVTNLKLAETYTKISEAGGDIFYSGDMAKQIASEFQKAGGVISADDLKNYKAIERPTVQVNLPNAKLSVVTPPVPSGGPVLAMIMSIMDRFNTSGKLFKENPTLHWHRTVEAFKHAFGAKTYYGDPAFVTNAESSMKNFLSTKFITQVRNKIKDKRTFSDPKYYGALPLSKTTKRQTSTVHISVLAPSGDAVSVTASINWFFGSHFVSPSTGVIFNDEMSDFLTDIKPDQDSPNAIEPGKRPQSSMSPCFLYDKSSKNVVFIIGAAGGTHIPTATSLALLRLLYFGTEELSDAIEARRIHHGLIPNTVIYEPKFNQEILKGLRKLGHNVTRSPSPTMSHVNGVKNHITHVHAHSDERDLGAGADGW